MGESPGARIPIRAGRLVENVADTILPLSISPNLQNVDVEKPGEAKRRKGFIRALNTDFGGTVTLVRKFEDADGTEVYIVIGPDGVNRET